MGDREWVICPRPNPRASVRLLCLPYAGGGASAFRTWAEEAPGDLEVRGGPAPRAREPVESRSPSPPSRRSSPSSPDALLPGLKAPFALLGHSMGALIGFELHA